MPAPSDPNDYSGIDPVILAYAQAHIAHHRCQRHLRRSLDANDPGQPCGSLLRLGPVGARAVSRHHGQTVVILQCLEHQHGQILRVEPSPTP